MVLVFALKVWCFMNDLIVGLIPELSAYFRSFDCHYSNHMCGIIGPELLGCNFPSHFGAFAGSEAVNCWKVLIFGCLSMCAGGCGAWPGINCGYSLFVVLFGFLF